MTPTVVGTRRDRAAGVSRVNRYRQKVSPLCSPLDVGFRELKEAIRRRDARERRGSLGFTRRRSPLCSLDEFMGANSLFFSRSG